MPTTNWRFWPSRDELIATSGTIFCSLFVIFFDVVLSGYYVTAALICPIWLLVSIVRIRIRYPGNRIAAVRILFPIITLLLVVANSSGQYTMAKSRATQLIQACERYHEANGAYPEQLNDLVPNYVDSIPPAKYCLERSDFEYTGPPHPLLLWYVCPPFARNVYDFEAAEWRFVD
ncbi:MAG: hypothetical protein U0805_13630 [Pirellulales bacterium]